MGPVTIARVMSRGAYDLSCDDGKVINATRDYLKVYRKPATYSDGDNGLDSNILNSAD